MSYILRRSRWPFPDCRRNGILQYVAFWVWLLSFVFSGLVRVVSMSQYLSPFLSNFWASWMVVPTCSGPSLLRDFSPKPLGRSASQMPPLVTLQMLFSFLGFLFLYSSNGKLLDAKWSSVPISSSLPAPGLCRVWTREQGLPPRPGAAPVPWAFRKTPSSAPLGPEGGLVCSLVSLSFTQIPETRAGRNPRQNEHTLK